MQCIKIKVVYKSVYIHSLYLVSLDAGSLSVVEFYKWFATHFPAWKHLFILKNLTGEPLTPWSALPPSWATVCPTFPLRKLFPSLKSCFSAFIAWLRRNLSSVLFHRTSSHKLACKLVEILKFEYETTFDSCKVKVQTNVDHIKWACWIYKLTKCPQKMPFSTTQLEKRRRLAFLRNVFSFHLSWHHSHHGFWT